jgi:hypothetical protein
VVNWLLRKPLVITTFSGRDYVVYDVNAHVYCRNFLRIIGQFNGKRRWEKNDNVLLLSSCFGRARM